MSAIITDQLRVLNAANFAAGIKTTTNSYYSFINLPNATDVQSDWDSNVPDPIDSLVLVVMVIFGSISILLIQEILLNLNQLILSQFLMIGKVLQMQILLQ
jgi:hypothetical protein